MSDFTAEQLERVTKWLGYSAPLRLCPVTGQPGELRDGGWYAGRKFIGTDADLIGDIIATAMLKGLRISIHASGFNGTYNCRVELEEFAHNGHGERVKVGEHTTPFYACISAVLKLIEAQEKP